ncbi:Endonuclease/Exonuclease/phosphatase family protein [Pustulibacterium marinum]|uniref:Endonuclease/Exonuclease/phosphatase family protein n=1 Tax=Pustulibacterium marinum TaxID=1224947 RepID=A0A1I7G4J2_9FLAO|nr:endonuclease/exonuclease/phosphatase family protein [Pustulibacterium marinum]SFU43382.1 Endonuclease/Exonuclease/phosphatase family protein [Pustulibacterium marinum]
MKVFFSTILFFCCILIAQAQLKIASWNIENMGRTKSTEEIAFMAAQLKDFDVVAIQEVVAGYGGPQAIAKLNDALNRTGSKWSYVLSDPTKSDPYSKERYAFLFKTAAVKLEGKPHLDSFYAEEIEREPFMATFCYQDEMVTLVSLHAIPKSKQPETELKYLKFFPKNYPDDRLVFLGDFNCPQSHTVFRPLKTMGFQQALVNQKTSLKRKCTTTCLANEYDNFFIQKDIVLKSVGVIRFYESFTDFSEAHYISDHIPIWIEIEL